MVAESGQLVPKIARLEQSERLGEKKYLEDRVTNPTIYTAPERLRMPYHYSYAAPAYGLGAIALRMLTSYDSRMKKHKGGPPITSKSYGEWITKIVSPSLKEAPDNTQKLIKGLLHSKPHERWTVEECYIFLTQALSPHRHASSDGGRDRGKKRQRTDPSSVAPNLGARAIKKPAPMSASSAPRSEPQATEGTSARKVEMCREPQHAHFTQEAKPAKPAKPAQVEGEPVANETGQIKAEKETKDDELPDTLSWDNGPQDPDDAGGAADGAPPESFATVESWVDAQAENTFNGEHLNGGAVANGEEPGALSQDWVPLDPPYPLRRS